MLVYSFASLSKHPCTKSFIHSHIHYPFIHPLLHSFILIYLSILTFLVSLSLSQSVTIQCIHARACSEQRSHASPRPWLNAQPLLPCYANHDHWFSFIHSFLHSPYIHSFIDSFTHSFIHRTCSEQRSRESPRPSHVAHRASLDCARYSPAAHAEPPHLDPRNRRLQSMAPVWLCRFSVSSRRRQRNPPSSAPPLIRRCPFDQKTTQREWWPPPPATRATETVSTVRKSILREVSERPSRLI